MSHTPLDSLMFLNSASPLLDWCTEELDGIYSDEPDLEAVSSLLHAFTQMIRSELEIHGGWRTHYSTGNPVRVLEEKHGIEPDPDGGPDRIVLQQFVRTGYPDGTLDHPDTRTARGAVS